MRAMVLAAGLGTRMRPLTDTLPKPLVTVAGQALLDHVLDRLADAGVETAVVNVHHMADQIENHLKGRTRPKIEISDERGELLDTGGGVVKALKRLGPSPFFHMNADTLWIEGVTPNLSRLAAPFDGARMDISLPLAPGPARDGLARARDLEPCDLGGFAKGRFLAQPDVRPRRGCRQALRAAAQRPLDARRHTRG